MQVYSACYFFGGLTKDPLDIAGGMNLKLIMFTWCFMFLGKMDTML